MTSNLATKVQRQSGSVAPTGATISLYYTGFGDCYLLQFDCVGQTRKVLIDCGVHPQGRNENFPIDEVVKTVIDDAGGHFDIVVCTHRHMDHITGFASPRWSEVTAKEIWMPWTEDPENADGKTLRAAQDEAARRLEGLISTASPTLLQSPQLDMAQHFLLNSSPNATAMKTLQEGFSGNPLRRYLPTKTPMETITTDALPGVKIHVLGPSRDVSVIKKMNPPSTESYIGDKSIDGDENDEFSPFRADWIVPDEKYSSNFPNLKIEDAVRDSLARTSLDQTLDAAASLENSINGTSLVLMFEFDDKFLLFPGDAQWGTWQMMLNDATMRDLLEKTTFYKVGHHCSHNGTPKTFVDEVLGKDVNAMVSVHPVAIWPQIPRVPLLEALKEKPGAQVCVSDQPDQMPKNFGNKDDKVFSITV